MPATSDALGRRDHVKAGAYDPRSPFDQSNSGNVINDASTEDGSFMQQENEAGDWLEIASPDPPPSTYPFTLLSEILAPSNCSDPYGRERGTGSAVAAGRFDLESLGDRMEVDDVNTDTHSEEENSVTSLPTLTTGSSVVASGELDDDVQMIDSGPESPQPQVVWPTLSGIKPPLLQTIELTPASVETYGASLHSTQNYMRPQGDSGKRGGSSSTTRHPASSPSGVRSRTLRHPEDTNEVRKKGACYRCRISRVKCNTDEPCHKCNIAPSKPGGEFVRETCIRDEPSKVGGVTAVHERWSWNEPLNLRRDDLKKASRGFLLVRFEDTPNGPFLKVATNSFTRPDRESNGSSLYDIIPNEGPAFDDDICNWAKNQILFENKQDFESCHEKLLQSYVETNGLQKAPRDTQTKLLEKVLRMRCMWKVWSCERFVIRTADDSPLPGSWDVSVVQDYLHRVAEQALSIVEKNILADLDKYLSPISPGDTKANISMYIAMWMILWQMILLYRQSLERTLRHQELRQQQPNAAPFVLGMNAASSKRYKFREVTEKLYNAVVVMYSELFRTRKVLEGLKDAGVNEFGNDSILYRAFRETWKARDSFYRQIDEDRGFHHNGLLGSLVVDKEKAAFKKGRGHKANV